MTATVEICVEGLASALEAHGGGADRIELCENLAVGGVTPGSGAIRVACERAQTPAHVLIRPRGGDFLYSGFEFEAMEHDVESAGKLGASGVVLGLLTADRRVDRDRTGRLIEAARPLKVTFHKAFDSSRDPFEALDDLISLGVDRILTSGQAPTAFDGLATLVALKSRAKGRITIMAGGSISLPQIRPIIEAGLEEIHLGSAGCLGGSTDARRVQSIMDLARLSEIYHITRRSDWEKARASHHYEPESLATEGFLHASTAGQVAGSADRFFRGVDGLVLLKIDLGRLDAPVRWAPSPHSDSPFPHVHGPINLDAVVEVLPMEPDFSGPFHRPSTL